MSVALEGFEPQTTPANQSVDPVKPVSMASFQNDVMVASTRAPVLVYFTATWCGPCKQLGPALEKTVRSYNGKVTLAKIDIDANPQLAQMLQVQSVPAVFAFVAGQPVDAFMGAVPESQLKLFIDRALQAMGLNAANEEDDSDDPFAPAMAAFTDGNMIAAQEQFQAILAQDKNNPRAQAGLDISKDLLSAGVPGRAEKLAADIAKDAKNLQLRFDYADTLLASGQIEQSAAQLLKLIRQDRKWNEEAARLRLLQIFDLLGNDDPVTQDSRRQLSRILFS